MRNKGERLQKQKTVFKRRLKNYRIDNELIIAGFGIKKKINFNCYRTTGKPCSCPNCSPGKIEEKSKYRLNKFRKEDIYE